MVWTRLASYPLQYGNWPWWNNPPIWKDSSALSFRVLTPSLLLLVVGVSDAFVRDWSGKDNWIFLSSGSHSVSLIWYICVSGLAYLYGMWAWFGLFFSLIWHNLEPGLAYLWACFSSFVSLIWHICEPALAYFWAWFGMFQVIFVSARFGPVM